MVIGLKTVKGTKQLKLDPTIYDSLQASHGGVQRLFGSCTLCRAEPCLVGWSPHMDVQPAGKAVQRSSCRMPHCMLMSHVLVRLVRFGS